MADWFDEKSGYVKLWRKSVHTGIWDDPFLWRLFTGCLLWAASAPRDVRVEKELVHLEPGQFVIGRKSLCARLYPKGGSPHQMTVWRWLEDLQMRRLVRILVRRRYSIVSICNWNKYQNGSPANAQTCAQTFAQTTENAQTFAQTCAQTLNDETPNGIETFDDDAVPDAQTCAPKYAHKQEEEKSSVFRRVTEKEKGSCLCAPLSQNASGKPNSEKTESESTTESKFTADAAALLGRTDLPPGLLRFYDHCRKINRNLQPWFCKEVEFAFVLGVTAREAIAFIDKHKELLVDPRKLCKALVAEHEKRKQEVRPEGMPPYVTYIIDPATGKEVVDMSRWR